MDKKKKKLSRPAKFTILTGCLPLAVCGYALTLKFSEAAEAVDGTEEINFVSAATENIAKLSWTYDGEVYSLTRYDDGTWIRPDDDDFAVEQDTADSMLDTAANIGASMRITDVTDYSQYGLEEPQSRIILEYAAEGDSDAADDTEGNAGLKKSFKESYFSRMTTPFCMRYNTTKYDFFVNRCGRFR